MQLLLKREQKPGMMYVKFTVWAKFEVSIDEAVLINKYNADSAILWEGNPRRDAFRAILWGFFPGLLLSIFLIAYTQNTLRWGPGTMLLIPLVVWPAVIYAVYTQIRELVKVSDILTGRTFVCRSVCTLVAKEQTITEMAVVFRCFLETMKDWGGTEVIEISPERRPVLRLIEHAAA
jgi:hypothetical protein